VDAVVREKLSLHGFGDLAWRLFLNGQRRNIFDRALNTFGINPDAALVDELVATYRAHPPSISLANDAIECLNALRHHCSLALITDGPPASQENKIRALGLQQWIPFTILTGNWGSAFSKPHPRAFVMAQQQSGTSPEHCWYVGDNPLKDFASPQQLGWRTVRIKREGGLYTHLDNVRCPDYQFDNLHPLTSIVSQA